MVRPLSALSRSRSRLWKMKVTNVENAIIIIWIRWWGTKKGWRRVMKGGVVLQHLHWSSHHVDSLDSGGGFGWARTSRPRVNSAIDVAGFLSQVFDPRLELPTVPPSLSRTHSREPGILGKIFKPIPNRIESMKKVFSIFFRSGWKNGDLESLEISRTIFEAFGSMRVKILKYVSAKRERERCTK